MNSFLLAIALTWPANCERFGELYRTAAQVRDSGVTREKALEGTQTRNARLAIIHVYERPDMSPSDWRWIAVGICVGQSDPGPRATNWSM